MEKVRRQHYVPRMYLKRFGYAACNGTKIFVWYIEYDQIYEKNVGSKIGRKK